MLNFETRTYKLTGISPILGSQAASQAVRTQYISSKAPTDELRSEEDQLGPDLDERGLTVFLRDDKERLILMDYVIKGFFKAAFSALRAQTGVLSEKSKIDKHVFIAPRQLVLHRDGKPIIDEDDQLERPLRAETMQGPRVALAASEMVNDPWTIVFTVTLLPNAGSAKSKAITWEAIEAALDYGKLCGLGQWRNGGYGRFAWKEVRNDD